MRNKLSIRLKSSGYHLFNVSELKIVNLVLVPVSLTDQPGVVPSLDRTPSELETTRPVSNPVPGTLQLLVVRALAKLEPGRVHGVNVTQGIAEFVDLGSRLSTT